VGGGGWWRVVGPNEVVVGGVEGDGMYSASRTTGVRSTASRPGNSSSAILKVFVSTTRRKECDAENRRTNLLQGRVPGRQYI
jgi:hypothetical protein